MKLAGDIGGTKVLLALVDDAGHLSHECRLASVDFSDFESLLAGYLAGVPALPEGGCLAVAGPVADDGRSAKITNLPWTIDATSIETRLGLGRLKLINDFAGAALGVMVTGRDQLISLQAGEPRADGVKLVIGAGTGLGMALLVHECGGWRVLPGEGGHSAFAPADAVQLRVWQTLHAAHGRVTCERVISGPGLASIHLALHGEALDAGTVSARAMADDAAARASAAVFLSAYGAFAGDMALAVMARGGVYLAGGIAAKILPLLQAGEFMTAFNAKAEHATLAQRMPVIVVTDERLGLRGAATAARQSLD